MEDKEIIGKIKNCKTAAEFKTLGKEIGYELTDEEAKVFFEQLNKSGELTDDELTNVSGAGCTRWRRGRAYGGNSPHYLITTIGNYCKFYSGPIRAGLKNTCFTCFSIDKDPGRLTCYCTKRQYDNDPLNP